MATANANPIGQFAGFANDRPVGRNDLARPLKVPLEKVAIPFSEYAPGIAFMPTPSLP